MFIYKFKCSLQNLSDLQIRASQANLLPDIFKYLFPFMDTFCAMNRNIDEVGECMIADFCTLPRNSRPSPEHGMTVVDATYAAY